MNTVLEKWHEHENPDIVHLSYEEYDGYVEGAFDELMNLKAVNVVLGITSIIPNVGCLANLNDGMDSVMLVY